jgi:nicotinate-nucleotide pyrophosphorylase (carboxylating)
MNPAILSTAALRTTVAQALAEDMPDRDVTTQALFDGPVRALGRMIAEEPEGFVVGGLLVALEVFSQADPTLICRPACDDGQWVSPGSTLVTISGDGRSILKGERVALNFLQHLSGIATLTARFCDAVKGTRASILDTRKTTPGLRALEKWAVKLGGGRNHRYGLSDGVLIKDNHLALAGGDVARACRLAREHAPHGFKVAVETGSLQQVRAALEGEADVILLDNMEPAIIRQAVELIKGQAIVEVSGGVTMRNVREIAAAGPDLISIGALTHSAPAMNISLDLSRE